MPEGERSSLKTWSALIALVVTTRAIALLAMHLEPNAYLLRAFLHLLPLDILLERPVEAVWNLHAQPPLYNALLALAVSLLRSSDASRVVWAMYFLNCGFTLFSARAGLRLVTNLTGSRRAGMVAAAVLVLNPAAVLYEAWPLYASLSSFLFLAMACALERFLATRSWGWAMALVSAICATSLTNSKLPPIVAVPLCAWVVFGAQPTPWRRRWLLCAPVVLVLVFQVKNIVRFNTYSLSSIGGCNLIRVAPEEGIARVTPRPAELGSFHPANDYRSGLTENGVPELGRFLKRSGDDTFVNINQRRYPEICNELGAYATRAIAADPLGYLQNVARSFVLYFNASSQHFSLNQNGNADALQPYSWPWEHVLFAGIDVSKYYRAPFTPFDQTIALRDQTARVTVFAVLSIAVWLWLLRVGFSARADRRVFLALALMLLAHLAVSIGFELKENARFKFDVEGLYLCLFVVAGHQLARLRATKTWRRTLRETLLRKTSGEGARPSPRGAR